MALSANKIIRHKEAPTIIKIKLASGAHTIYKGALMNLNAAGYGKIAADALGEKFAGIAMEYKLIAAGDNGTNGVLELEVLAPKNGRWVELDVASTITIANERDAVYVDADDKVDVVAGTILNTTGGAVGIIGQYISANKAWVQMV